jgi:hypothetical protein
MEIGIAISYHQDPNTRVKTIEIRKTSFGSLESFDDKNHAQITSDNSNDVNDEPFDSNDTDNESFGKTEENRAQNTTPNDSNGSNDTFGTLQGQGIPISESEHPNNNTAEDSYYECYHCDSFKTEVESDYELHVVIKHPGKLAYPDKAEIEKLGLKPQGKSWEM